MLKYAHTHTHTHTHTHIHTYTHVRNCTHMHTCKHFSLLKKLKLKFIVYNSFCFSCTLSLRVSTHTNRTRTLCQRTCLSETAEQNQNVNFLRRQQVQRLKSELETGLKRTDHFITVDFSLKYSKKETKKRFCFSFKKRKEDKIKK